MMFDKALAEFKSGDIDFQDYAEAWLEEWKFCYAKHGGRVQHFIIFAEPAHWSFGIMDLSDCTTSMLGTSRGNITIPTCTIHPELAARAVIAFETLVVGTEVKE